MKVQVISSLSLEHAGLRLDCGPYLSGALTSKLLLDRFPGKKMRIGELTENGEQGVFHAGREGRTWVETPEYGVPFLGSTDILAADLSRLPLISRRQVSRNSKFTVRTGWTLITRSGTIGRMAYCREDMDGMACSEHVMRVVPDSNKIAPGYLYAFLSSKFGVPMVVSGTYGSIIQSIEPQHIINLPIPRMSRSAESEIHQLVHQSSEKRVLAAKIVREAISALEEIAGLPNLPVPVSAMPFSITHINDSNLSNRLDAFFYSTYHQEAIDGLKSSGCPLSSVGEIASKIFEPTRLKRIPIEESDYGVPFFGTSALMWADPQPSYYLPRRQKSTSEYIVEASTLLIPRSGQLSGLIGLPILPFGQVVGAAVSEHAIRVHCDQTFEAGYLFVALNSQYGVRQLKSRAYGSSIPSLDVRQVGQVLLPDIGDKAKKKIGALGLQSAAFRDEAIQLENSARHLVETAIEGS